MATNNRKVAIIATLVIMTGMVALSLFTKTFDKPLLISRTDPPKIKIDEPQHAFGSVEEGTSVPHVFTIQNIGGKPLLLSADTSCGCTELALSSQKVLPGESTDLKVTMDTSLKHGFVSKKINIHSNDPKNPLYIVTISATVLPRSNNALLPIPNSTDGNTAINLGPKDNSEGENPDPHANLMVKPGQPIKLFTGKCATCHVQQGKGKKSGDLFMADCAMCHGIDAKGKVGPSLISGDFSDKAYVENFVRTIQFGSPTNPSMPGFSKAANGPLSDEDIQSIVTYLEQTAKEQKNTATSN